jgi:hypothetical protein
LPEVEPFEAGRSDLAAGSDEASEALGGGRDEAKPEVGGLNAEDDEADGGGKPSLEAKELPLEREGLEEGRGIVAAALDGPASEAESDPELESESYPDTRPSGIVETPRLVQLLSLWRGSNRQADRSVVYYSTMARSLQGATSAFPRVRKSIWLRGGAVSEIFPSRVD